MGITLLAERDECCDEMPVPVEGVFDLELGSDVRSGSEAIVGGKGERDALLVERCDICDAEREPGMSDATDALRFSTVEELPPLPWLDPCVW